MGISLKTHKMLWGRAANRCAKPDCRIELVMDASETDDESLIGEECHIFARSPDGPRGDSSFPKERIDKYDNLVLMCSIHHKLIDDQPSTYPVDKLKEIKSNHEKWVKESLSSFDSQKQREDEIYATYIEKWIELSHLEQWKAWSSHIFGGGQPKLWKNVDEDLRELRDWIFSRIWPSRYPELEDAFENFRRILQNFQNVFHEYSAEAPEMFYTRKFYQISEWNEEKYEKLGKRYEFHVDLVEDLMLELTRGTNYICDIVRQYIDPVFRLNEGLILVESGPYMDMSFRQHKVMYRGEERISILYPGINEFKKIRNKRDYSFGIGSDADDPEFLEWSRNRE